MPTSLLVGLTMEFEVEFGLGAAVVPVGEFFALSAPQRPLDEGGAPDRDADARCLPDDAARDQALPDFCSWHTR